MFYVRLATLAGMLTLLPGCFLEQQAPQPQSQPVTPGPTVDGLVTLIEEHLGTRAAAELTATFAAIPAGTQTASPSTNRVYRYADALVSDGDPTERRVLAQALDRLHEAPRGTDCQRQQGVPGNPGTDTTVYYDAGTVGFGPELQTTLQPLTEDPTSHAYHLDLAPPFPPGSYLVHTDGTSQVPQFDADLAMPEELDGVTINGKPITQSGFTIPRSSPLQIQWQPPVTPNDQNMMMLLIVTQSAKAEQDLQCLGYESDVAGTASSVASWTIDAEWLADLIDSSNAQVYFVRQIVRKGTSGSLQIELDGIRVWQTQVTIGN
jgi:hypothetical protein